MEEILRINTAEVSEALKYFDLPVKCNVEQLEAAKFTKSSLNPIKKLTTDKHYKNLLDFVMYSNKNFFAYKDEFLKGFKQKFYKLPSKFPNNDALNNDIADIIKTIKFYYEGLAKDKQEDDFKIGMHMFYVEYQSRVEKFLKDYLDYLNGYSAIDLSSTLNEIEQQVKANTIDMSVYDLCVLCNEKLATANNNKNKLRKLFKSKYLYQLDCYFKDEEYQELLEPYYEEIDKFINELSIRIDKLVNSVVILDAKDVEEEYANICDEIQETVEMFGDRIDDTIVRNLKEMIKKVASNKVRETLEHKLHFADTIESYKEIYDIATREQGNNLQNR